MSINRIVDQFGRPAEIDHKRNTDVQEIARIFARQDAAGVGYHRNPYRGSSWIYAIISDIAINCGDIPFGLWKPNKKKAKFSTKNWTPYQDTNFELLMEKPNPLQSLSKFIQQWVVYYLSGGNVWAYIDEPNSTGIPRAIILFGIDSVQPIRAKPTMPPQAWQLRLPDGKYVQVPLDRMIHWGMPNDLDQWIGVPPWLSMDTQLQADKARVIFDRFFFENNATPDTVLTYKPGPLNKQNRDLIYEAWYDAYGGPEKHGGVAVVGGDFDIKVLGVSHSAAQYLESRKFTRQEAAAVYHYPVQLLNDMEGGSLGRDHLSMARMMKYENVIFPTAAQFAEGVTLGIVRKYVKDTSVKAYFDYDGLPVMVDFMKAKADILKVLVASGIPVNEAVAKLDMGFEPVEGGDKGYIASNMVEIGTEPPTKPVPLAPPKPAPKRIDSDLIPMCKFVSRRMKRFFFDVRNDCFRALDSPECFKVETVQNNYRSKFGAIYLGALQIGVDLASGRKPWIKNTNSIDEGINFLRQRYDMIDRDNVLKRSAEQLMEEFLPVIQQVASEVNSAPVADRERQIRCSFDGMIEVTRKLAKREVLKSVKHGRFAIGDFSQIVKHAA